mmetsp:Transcript_5429/g.9143  ORF Transcript_5429/g.9143 Transcript_5429/m.9143 type:complete len:126 (-) Transcript_5429:37-414(-)
MGLDVWDFEHIEKAENIEDLEGEGSFPDTYLQPQEVAGERKSMSKREKLMDDKVKNFQYYDQFDALDSSKDKPRNQPVRGLNKIQSESMSFNGRVESEAMEKNEPIILDKDDSSSDFEKIVRDIE